MEEVVILDADGRPVKGMQLDRNTIHLGEANGGYMGCTKALKRLSTSLLVVSNGSKILI